jgi:hypothetical protein
MLIYKIKTLAIITILMTMTSACNLSSSSDSSSSTPPSVWLIGVNAPDNTVGNDLDMFLNTNTSDVYQKQNGSWGLQENIKGSSGPQGIQGVAGSTWYSGVTDPDPTVLLGVNGDFYVNTVTNNVFQKTNNLWNKTFNLQGAAGATGPQGLAGVNGSFWFNGTIDPPPASIAAKTGDLYLNTNTGEVYLFGSSASWTGPIAVLKGQNGTSGINGTNGTNGTNGVNGAQWITGSGVPNPAIGNSGDFFINISNNNVYQKSSGGWGSVITTLSGPQGVQGTAGQNGTNGTFWCTGTATNPNSGPITGCSNSGNGNLNDFYFNSSSGGIWQKTDNSTWTQIFTMASVTNQTPPVPVGTIISYPITTCPTNYVFVDGSLQSTTGTYAPLFAVIGFEFGGSSGTGMFKFPPEQTGPFTTCIKYQ